MKSFTSQPIFRPAVRGKNVNIEPTPYEAIGRLVRKVNYGSLKMEIYKLY
jgi:hypothetical protein